MSQPQPLPELPIPASWLTPIGVAFGFLSMLGSYLGLSTSSIQSTEAAILAIVGGVLALGTIISEHWSKAHVHTAVAKALASVQQTQITYGPVTPAPTVPSSSDATSAVPTVPQSAI